MRPMVSILLSAGLCGAASLGCHGSTCEELRACIRAKDGAVPDADVPNHAAGGNDRPDARAPSADASEARNAEAGSGAGGSGSEGRSGGAGTADAGSHSQSERAAGAGGSGGAGGTSAGTGAGGGVPSGTTTPKPGSQDGGGNLVDCGPPPKPSDGEVNAPSTTLGSSATYTCKEGYNRRGVQDRTCQATGTWSDATPTCEFVDCKALSSPTNGAVQAARTTYGAEAKYTCQDGYGQAGSPSRSCQADGSWSGTAPTCIAKTCGTLASPARGNVAVTGTSYGSTATYTCAAPSVLTSSATRTCQTDGKWSGSSPECQPPTSCQGGQVGAGMNCGGANGTDDCCASPLVEGGTFNRENRATNPATVSNFRLDKYEITVGRFRAFVAAGMGTRANPPASGSGANPRVSGSGWDSAWNTGLSATTADLKAAVQCNATDQTWTGNDDKRPMNCITWYEAFAFCVWDGARLPTDLEWNYAAAGGSDERAYPWGSTEPNATLAVYAFDGRSCTGIDCVAPVGSTPAGRGKWGQDDLGGSVWEWALDIYASYPSRCSDCANVSGTGDRVIQGGGFTTDYSFLLTSMSWGMPSVPREDYFGARCARTP